MGPMSIPARFDDAQSKTSHAHHCDGGEVTDFCSGWKGISYECGLRDVACSLRSGRMRFPMTLWSPSARERSVDTASRRVIFFGLQTGGDLCAE